MVTKNLSLSDGSRVRVTHEWAEIAQGYKLPVSIRTTELDTGLPIRQGEPGFDEIVQAVTPRQ